MKSNSIKSQLILGRDFLSDHEISITINSSKKDLKTRAYLFSEIASTDIVDFTVYKVSNVLNDINTDFDVSMERQLISIIKEVESSNILMIEDDYSVKVNLKDESVFAFSPRRFAYNEKIQIREITDDLLSRNIIKESNSPYCARVVPVRKKTVP